MGKSRHQTVWVDSARTRTAADIFSLGECDALIDRFHRDIAEMKLKGAEAEDAPRNQRQALFYRTVGLRELEKRRSQLLA